MNRILFLCSLVLIGFPSFAKEIVLPQVGRHHKILVFEKNENSQNILVIYTRLDKNCRFKMAKGEPVIDFYWLMNRTHYKRTHPLIKRAIRKRLKTNLVESRDEGETLKLEIRELKELKSLDKDPHLLVKTKNTGKNCELNTYYYEKQPEKRTLVVESLYSQSKKTLRPPFRKVEWVSLNGTDLDSGMPVRKKFASY